MEKRVCLRFKIADKDKKAELITTESVKIKDISLGGICLETSQYLDTKNSFRVEIASNDNEKITPECEISWSSLLVTIEKDLSIYEVGLKFTRLTDSEKRFLDKYVNTITS